MREHPILFSGPMIRALLAGTKTQTRRVMKPQPLLTPEIDSVAGTAEFYTGDELAGWQRCPYGRVGDLLWVKETHAPGVDQWGAWSRRMAGDRSGPDPVLHFAADGGERPFIEKWRPSIHMPRWASRILLRVTDQRVERLTACSASDAEAEGAIDWSMECASRVGAGPITAYRALWESINGTGSWEANPWVWVIEFERVTP